MRWVGRCAPNCWKLPQMTGNRLRSTPDTLDRPHCMSGTRPSHQDLSMDGKMTLADTGTPQRSSRPNDGPNGIGHGPQPGWPSIRLLWMSISMSCKHCSLQAFASALLHCARRPITPPLHHRHHRQTPPAGCYPERSGQGQHSPHSL